MNDLSAAAAAARLEIGPATNDDASGLVALWERCGLTRPWNDPHADLAKARDKTNSDVLVGRDGATIVASVMVGHDGHRGCVYYVSVDPDRQKAGYGRAILTAAETWLRERGIEKLQLMVRPGNAEAQAFYEAIGFEEQPRIIYAKWLDGREMTP
jgi:ribosomal protein S18 acetylase RimI-like enzyme